MQGLYQCLSRGDAAELQALISSTGADVNKKDGIGRPPLSQAVQDGSVACTKLLLDLGADPNMADDTTSLTPLCQAADMGRLDLAQLLVSKGGDPDVMPLYSTTALVRAVHSQNGGVDMVRYLVDLGVDLDHPTRNDGTALTASCQRGMMDRLIFLLEAGADINQTDKQGYSPLEMACKHFRLNMIKELLKRGAHTGSGLIILTRWNQIRRNVDLIHCFLEAGVDVNFRPDRFTKSALTETVLKNQVEIFNILVCHGAEVRESLHIAVLFQIETFLGDLIMAGATPHLEKYFHLYRYVSHPEKLMSPFSIAVDLKNFQLASCFLSAWFLHSSDIHHVIHRGELRDALHTDDHNDTTDYLHDVITRPLSLACLSFVTVSMCVGFGKDREERIGELPIPAVMRNRLLFRGLAKELSSRYPHKRVS